MANTVPPMTEPQLHWHPYPVVVGESAMLIDSSVLTQCAVLAT